MYSLFLQHIFIFIYFFLFYFICTELSVRKRDRGRDDGRINSNVIWRTRREKKKKLYVVWCRAEQSVRVRICCYCCTTEKGIWNIYIIYKLFCTDQRLRIVALCVFGVVVADLFFFLFRLIIVPFYDSSVVPFFGIFLQRCGTRDIYVCELLFLSSFDDLLVEQYVERYTASIYFYAYTKAISNTLCYVLRKSMHSNDARWMKKKHTQNINFVWPKYLVRKRGAHSTHTQLLFITFHFQFNIFFMCSKINMD